MRYTVFVRELREVKIYVKDRAQLIDYMEHHFPPGLDCELEEWKIQYAQSSDGEQVADEIDVLWRPFPQPEENDT